MISPNAKQEYQKNTETKLKKIRSRISTLEKWVGKAEADIEVRYDQKLEQIRGHYAQAKDKLEKLRKANHDAWLDQKPELERSIDTLNEALDRVASHISV